MADDDFEQGLIRHLRQAGLITPEQFARAEADATRSGALDGRKLVGGTYDWQAHVYDVSSLK